MALSLLASAGPRVTAQAPAKAAAAKPATAAAPVDGGWPRASTTPSGAELVVYQPQISSWPDQKNVVLYAAVSYTPKGAAKPALGTVKVESATNVATDRRLVSFSEFRITESNFSTLQRDQVGTLRRGAHRRRAAQRARDRARSRTRQRRQEPDHSEEHRRREGRSATHLFQQDAGRAGERRRRSDLESDQGQRPPVRREHELGPLPAHADQDACTCAPPTPGSRPRRCRARGPTRVRCPTASTSCRTTRTGRTPKARCRARRSRRPMRRRVFATTTPAELILLKGEPAYVPGRRYRRSAVGQQHRERPVPGEPQRPGVLSDVGALVLGAGLRRSVDVCLAQSACRLQEDSARARRGRACSHRSPVRPKRQKRCCSRRSRRRRPSARTCKRQRSPIKGRRSSSRSRRPRSSAPSTPTRTSSRSAICTTCASRASGSCRRARPAHGRSPATCRRPSTRSRSAHRRTA